MTKISTYSFILKGGITSEPGKNTFVVPYKPGDVQSDFGGNGAMLLVNGGRLILREDTDTFQLTFGASSFTLTWRDLLHTVGDTDDVSITTDIFNTFVGLGIAGSTPGGPAGGDLTGVYPDPTLKAIIGAAGPVGDATHIPVITIDAKGRVTALSTILATSPGTSVPGGPAGGDLAGTYPNPTLVVIPALSGGGSAGNATNVPQITYDAKGRITAVVNTPITGVPGPATGPAGGDLTGTYPDPTIRAGAVMNSQLAAMGQAMVKGRPAGAGTGQPMDLNQAALLAIIGPVGTASSCRTVRVATTAAVVLASTIPGSLIDGVALVSGDVILVKNQAAAADNGVYTVGAGGSVRNVDFATYDKHPGTLITVQEGAIQADTLWLCTSNVGGTLNTTAIQWMAFTGGGGGSIVTGTSTRTNVPAAVVSTQLMPNSTARLGATIYNDSAAELLVNLGAVVSSSAFTVDMLPGSYYEVPFGFTGPIYGIWASATGNARITEFFV